MAQRNAHQVVDDTGKLIEKEIRRAGEEIRKAGEQIKMAGDRVAKAIEEGVDKRK